MVMGGTDEQNTVLDSGEKYDPDSNSWSPIPSMMQVSAGVYFGMIILFIDHQMSAEEQDETIDPLGEEDIRVYFSRSILVFF